MKASIAIVESVWGDALESLAKKYDIQLCPEAWSDMSLLKTLAATSDVLIVRNRTQVTRDLLENSEKLKLVARMGVGLDNIDVEAASELGVVVVAGIGANAVSVAEHTVGLALNLYRGVCRLDRDVRAGVWNRSPGRELSGGTWGLLSAGATARATGRVAKAMGMQVLAHDPYIDSCDPEIQELGIRLVGMEDLAAKSDVVSVHLPATPETINTVDAQFFAQMKRDAILINCGRGEVVNEEALTKALQAGQIYGAALDVRKLEPPRQPDPIAMLENVILTPHVAGITAESQARILDILCADIEAVLDGQAAQANVGSISIPRRER